MKAPMHDLDLVVRAKTDPLALSELCEGSELFIWRIIHKHVGRPKEVAGLYGLFEDVDLLQAGWIGFLQAVRHFDPSYGVKFTTYAAAMVRGMVLRFLSDNRRLVHVTRTAHGDLVEERVRERRLEETVHEELSLADTIQDPSDSFGLVEVCADFERLASGLGGMAGGVLRLRASGMTQKEIAQSLGTSQPTVSRVLAEARKRLVS